MGRDQGLEERTERFDESGFRSFIQGNVEEARRVVEEAGEGMKAGELVFLFVFVPFVLFAVEGVIRSDAGVLADFSRSYFRFPLTSEAFWSVPVLWKAFVSSYGHNSLHPHLSGTVFMYLVSMSALYPLSILADRKRSFYIFTAYSLVLVPIVASYFSWRNRVGRTSIGFSSVDAAFLGILPILLLVSVRERTGVPFVSLWSTGPLFLILGALVLVGGGSWSMVFLSVGMAVGLSLLMVLDIGFEDLMEGLHFMTWPSNVFSWWGVTAAVAGPYLVFFEVAPHTNVVGHLGGYLAGYLFALFLYWETPDLGTRFLERVVGD